MSFHQVQITTRYIYPYPEFPQDTMSFDGTRSHKLPRDTMASFYGENMNFQELPHESALVNISLYVYLYMYNCVCVIYMSIHICKLKNIYMYI